MEIERRKYGYTSSGLVLNRDHTKLLLVHHKKFDKWIQPGGHIDEGELSHECAIREVMEETGIKSKICENFQFYNKLGKIGSKFLPTPIMEFSYDFSNFQKPYRICIDKRFVLEALNEEIVPDYNEVKDVKWHNLNEVLSIYREEIWTDKIQEVAIKIMKG